MHSFAVRLIFGAALAATPLLSAATLANRAKTAPDVTLLTGPKLLSPSSRPLAVGSISSELVTPASAPARSKTNQNASVDDFFQPAASHPPADAIRFDTAFPVIPTDLLHSKPPAKSSTFKRE